MPKKPKANSTISAYKDYIRVYRVQAAQLRHNERKEASSRENGDKEVL